MTENSAGLPPSFSSRAMRADAHDLRAARAVVDGDRLVLVGPVLDQLGVGTGDLLTDGERVLRSSGRARVATTTPSGATSAIRERTVYSLRTSSNVFSIGPTLVLSRSGSVPPLRLFQGRPAQGLGGEDAPR